MKSLFSLRNIWSILVSVAAALATAISTLLGATTIRQMNCYVPTDTLGNMQLAELTYTGESGDTLTGTATGDCIPDDVPEAGGFYTGCGRLGANLVGGQATMGLADGMATACECRGFLVIHGHAAERLADIMGRGQRVGIAVRTFRVDIDQAHLHRGQRFFQFALLVVALIGFGKIDQMFFPDSSMQKFMIDYWAPMGTPIENTESANARRRRGKMSEMIECDGGLPPASPTPTPTRNNASWAKFWAAPISAVIRLQKASDSDTTRLRP